MPLYDVTIVLGIDAPNEQAAAEIAWEKANQIEEDDHPAAIITANVEKVE